MSTSLLEFEKAIKALERALEVEKTDIVRDAVIQRFEFCIELAWKVSKRIMGTVTSAPKQVVREMGQNGLIADVGFWLRAIDQGNLTAHTYNEDLAEEVYNFAQTFLPALNDLLNKLVKAQ